MSSVDGLVSGLNTKTIISQLMAVERLPENQLLTQKSRDTTMVSVLQGLNTLFGKLQTAAESFAPTSITTTSAWAAHTVSSSSSALATETV